MGKLTINISENGFLIITAMGWVSKMKERRFKRGGGGGASEINIETKL